MHRRKLILGIGALSGFAGCIGVNTETKSEGGGTASTTEEPQYAGGENTRATTETPDYPLIDAQRRAIRNALNARRQDESSGALEVNGVEPSELREVAQDHAENMADLGTVDINAGGSLVEAVERNHGTCQFQADESGESFSGAEVIFLGRVDAETATDPDAAADEFLSHWLNDIDARKVLLSSKARFLGLGLAYGSDGLYVAMILC